MSPPEEPDCALLATPFAVTACTTGPDNNALPILVGARPFFPVFGLVPGMGFAPSAGVAAGTTGKLKTEKTGDGLAGWVWESAASEGDGVGSGWSRKGAIGSFPSLWSGLRRFGAIGKFGFAAAGNVSGAGG